MSRLRDSAIPIIASSFVIIASFQLLGPPLKKIFSKYSLKQKLQESSNRPEDGIVTGLYVYPVKSLKAVSMKEVEMDSKGFVGDRRLMIVYELALPAWKHKFEATDTTHRFMSQRQCPSLARVSANLEGNNILLEYESKTLSVPLGPPVQKRSLRASIWDDHVTVDDLGDEVAAFFQKIVDGDEQASAAGKFKGIRMVIHSASDRKADPSWTPSVALSWLGASPPPVSLTDGFPILIASESSLKELNQKLKANNKEPVDMSRFRANIVIKGTKPFEEDYWKYIAIGDTIFALVKPCPRCKQSCTDQETGEVHSEPVETMKTFRALHNDNNSYVYFAQNAIPLSESGMLRVGDKIRILETGEPRYAA